MLNREANNGFALYLAYTNKSLSVVSSNDSHTLRFNRALRSFYLLIVFAIISTELFSQQRLFNNQQHFGVDNGLPQSYITSLVQDEDGFIWLSTMDGISRYDGRSFRTFPYNPKDSNRLSNSVIVGRGKLANNSLTLYFSPLQADEFNVRTFRAARNTARMLIQNIPDALQNPVRTSSTTPNAFFTVTKNKSIGWINYYTNEINYAGIAEGLISEDTAIAIAQAADQRIFVIYENGVAVSDTACKKFTWHAFPTHVNGTTGNKPGVLEKFSITCMGDNRVAVLQDQNILLLDVVKKERKTIPIPAHKPQNVQGYSSLLVDTKGRIYFEDYGRIFRVNEQDELTLLWEYTGPPERISAFYIDRSDVLWLSVNAQGLLKIDLKALHFASYQYTNSFTVDILNRVGSPSFTFPSFWNDRVIGYYFRQATGADNKSFFSNNWGDKGYIIQHDGKEFRRFLHVPDAVTYGALVSMPNNELWAYVQEERKWYTWKNANAIPTILATDSAAFAGIELADAKYIGNYIWASSYNHGLIQTDGLKIIRQFSGVQPNGILPNTLTEICADPLDNNKFWIGSRSAGLILWDVQKGLQRIYTMEDGLPNNTIYCILPDKAGKLWCSTNKGIFRFDQKTGMVTSFEKTDGLAGNEFNRAHKFRLTDGRLAFGGLDGYTIFNPDDFENSRVNQSVPLQITGLQINNEPQDINIPSSFIKESLSTLTDIELPYDKNYLRLEFAALLFNQPQKTKYRYQLKGVDANWVDNGHSNMASYAALNPGRYTFRINATDDTGLWSDTAKELNILIRPPFWATWWAYSIYALLIAALLRWYFVFRERRLSMQQTLAFEKREALRLREVDEMKDRFFSNITHEFRTPLTLIISPLEKLEHDPSLSPAAIGNVRTAQRNSKQLLRLINEFLLFSKLNSGQLKLKRTAGELSVFTAACVETFDVAAREKNITLHFSIKNVDGHYLFDEEKWEKIINNLLSNAIKFTPANGTVSVVLSAPGPESIQLVVTDNGPGIPIHQQGKIFTRFFQVDDSSIRQYGGTGIGLSLVKELTELMGGGIKLDSKPLVHTSFTVTVPMEQIHEPVRIAAKSTAAEIKEPPLADIDLPLLLIVEDNDELRAFLVETLQQQYRILEAADGLTALDIILQELPDMIISDVMMPGLDGYDLCQRCKNDNRTNHIGFILLTSKAAHDAVLKGLGMGADDYITKPFNMEELELRIANLFRLQQTQREWLQSELNPSKPAAAAPVVTDPFLLQLYKEIDAKLADDDLGVDYLCGVMAMSRSTLSRKLKSLLNTSPADLIRQQRLKKAAGLIAGGLDIASAAYQTGFSSPSYFSQCFKEQYGFTPSDWISQQC